MPQPNALSLAARSSLGLRALRSALLVALVLIVGGVVEAPSASAQPTRLTNFQRSGQYVLYASGRMVPATKLYLSQSSGAYLIEASVFPTPILLYTRTGCVEAVGQGEMTVRPDGGLDLSLASLPCRYGRYRIEGYDIVFRVGSTPARLKPKPHLLGSALAPALLDHTPEYGQKARLYRPDMRLLQRMAASGKKVRVFVLFGSWCTTCARKIPKMLRIEAELKKLGSPVTFDYWGLPGVPKFQNDPVVKSMRIAQVPIAFLYVGEQNIGRIEPKELDNPEAALSRFIR